MVLCAPGGLGNTRVYRYITACSENDTWIFPGAMLKYLRGDTTLKTDRKEYKPMNYNTPLYPGAMSQREMVQSILRKVASIAFTAFIVTALFAIVILTN